MNWLHLTESDQLDNIVKNSADQVIVLFKHSTRCSISSMAKDRLERQWGDDLGSVNTYYLDLLRYRPVSDRIGTLFGVEHQSPQILLIHKGACVYHASHGSISVSEIRTLIERIQN